MGECKGIDDLLAAGRRPRRLRGDDVGRHFDQLGEALFGGPPAPGPAGGGDVRPGPAGPPPFPTDVFPSPVADFVRRVAASVGCPEDFPGVAALVVGGAAAGAARCLELKKGWLEMPGLFAVVVSRPGTAKTPALQAVMAPVHEAQDRAYREHQEAVRVYQEEQDECE